MSKKNYRHRETKHYSKGNNAIANKQIESKTKAKTVEYREQKYG
jgi:hypothetical protein